MDFAMGDFTQITGKVKNAGTATVKYFKLHWLDYLLLTLICFVLGAFDVFILKRSENFLNADYWYHSGCRITAYVLASVLGVRIGYPRAKDACQALKVAFEKNQRLIFYKEIASEKFTDFICSVNNEVKKNAWKHKINAKLKKLENHSKDFFTLYYNDKSLEHFDRYKIGIKRLFYKHYIYKAQNYCIKRKTLESLITDEYINSNLNSLSIAYPRVKETDFESVGEVNGEYESFYTTPNIKKSTAKKICSGSLITILFILIMGSVTLSLDKALLEERVLSIFSIIINSILDIGLTLWKFLSGYFDCERLVRTEDLRSLVDQNRILTRFGNSLSEDYQKVFNEKVKETDKKDFTESVSNESVKKM